MTSGPPKTGRVWSNKKKKKVMGVKISKGANSSIGPIGLGEAHTLTKQRSTFTYHLHIPSDIFFNYGAITGNIHQLHSETIDVL